MNTQTNAPGGTDLKQSGKDGSDVDISGNDEEHENNVIEKKNFQKDFTEGNNQKIIAEENNQISQVSDKKAANTDSFFHQTASEKGVFDKHIGLKSSMDLIVSKNNNCIKTTILFHTFKDCLKILQTQTCNLFLTNGILFTNLLIPSLFIINYC